MSNHTINSIRKYIRIELSNHYPAEEIASLSKIILNETTGLTFPQILAYPENSVSLATWDKIKKICDDLKLHKPIQYILGKTEFFGVELKVNRDTLIPRQETEELVALILRENNSPGLNVLDIGTGSGAIAIALSKNLTMASVSATDISLPALKTAEENSLFNRCDILFIQDDILNSKLYPEVKFDLIVSNPPYVRESEKSLMDNNVLDYEPENALFVPDSDPLVFFRAICLAAPQLLNRGGSIYFEINEALGKETEALINRLGFSNSRIVKDLNGKERIITAKI